MLRAEISDNIIHSVIFFLSYFFYHSSCRKDQFTVLILKFGIVQTLFVSFSHWATCAPEICPEPLAFRPGFLAPILERGILYLTSTCFGLWLIQRGILLFIK